MKRGVPPLGPTRSGQVVAAELAAIADPATRRLFRLRLREAALTFRLEARRYERASKLADAIAKFGGGSLLTATLILVLDGQAGVAIGATAFLTLVLLVGGTAFWVYSTRQTHIWDDQAERIDAVLKETERLP